MDVKIKYKYRLYISNLFLVLNPFVLRSQTHAENSYFINILILVIYYLINYISI